MQIVRMDEFDLNGYLFVNYPMDLTIEESRERLELEIMEAAELAGSNVDDEDDVNISWYWINQVERMKWMRKVNKMTTLERQKIIDDFKKRRSAMVAA